MANTVKLRGVLCMICLWGQLSTSKLYQASNDEKNFEKITGSSATQNRF